MNEITSIYLLYVLYSDIKLCMVTFTTKAIHIMQATLNGQKTLPTSVLICFPSGV